MNFNASRPTVSHSCDWLEIRPYSRNLLPSLIRISEEAFGPGYFNDPVDLQFGTPLHLLALKSGRAVGFSTGYLSSLDGAIRELGCYFLREQLDGDPTMVGVIKTAAVAARHQRSGIGAALLQKTEEKLSGLGVIMILLPAWKGRRDIHIEPAVRKLGYGIAGTAPDYWKTECDRGDFLCLDRGSRCVCSMVVFVKVLERQ